MAVSILINQPTKPAGVVGRAREDLILGTDVDLTAVGGPFLAYQWSIIDKPVDYASSSQSGAYLSTINAANTKVQTVDNAGTYLVQIVVDSGFGLGARPEDVARITFYAGPALNPTYNELPRRKPAFQEKTEHNVTDSIFPAGNPRGHATELDRWLEAFSKIGIFAAARWNDGSGGMVSSKNIASITPVLGQPGCYDVQFTTPATDGNYLVLPVARGGTGGFVSSNGEATNGFLLYRSDPFGQQTSADFSFIVVVLP